ncbi:TPA: ligand-gated channel, partial [Vibrio vulnificus]
YSGISDKTQLMSNLAFRSGNTDSLLTVAYWQGKETRNFNQDNYQRELEGASANYQLNHFVGDALMLSIAADAYREGQIRREGSSGIHADGKWDQNQYYEDSHVTDLGVSAGLEYQPMDAFWFDEAKAKLYWRDMADVEDINRLYGRLDQNGITEQKRSLENNEFLDQLVGFRTDMTKA